MQRRTMTAAGLAGAAALVMLSGCGNADQGQWRLAVMTYTFHDGTLFEAIDKTQMTGANYIETYSWQPISADHGDMPFNDTASDAALEAVRQKLAAADITLTNYYFHNLGKDEAESRRVFQFCRDMDIEAIVSEPAPDDLERVDALAREYQVKVAIHNHARNPNDASYVYWDPVKVMDLLENRSDWMGTCADNGHWVRSGVDPLAGLKTYEGRLICMHLKDVDKVGPDAKDVPYTTGVVDMPQMLRELDRQGFSGVFSIEYESNIGNNEDEVRQCVRNFRRLRDEVR